MATVGDRVVFEGTKVGGGRREGKLLSIDGRAVRVQWDDGTESLLFPGPGAMTVVAGKSGKANGAKKPAKKAVKAQAKKATAKKQSEKKASKKR